MFASLFRTRTKPKHSRVSQQEAESVDSDSLLPCSPLEESCQLKSSALEWPSRDVRIAARTLIFSTIVYLGAGLWLGSKIQNATMVADVDDICMHHVSHYCEWGGLKMVSNKLANEQSTGRKRREAGLARSVVQRELPARERISTSSGSGS
jgi:hypothetical protein